jgi:DNA-binding XRE family transcriptional regulator
MNDSDAKAGGSQPVTPREATLAYIADKRRQDSKWDYRTDPAYNGPFPSFISMMSDADFDRYMAEKEEHRRLLADPRPVEPQVLPRMPVRAALPIGQRIRELRRALGWTQRQIARQLGVSARSIIRYEQGRSSPIRSRPLLALRRLESAYIGKLDTDGARP